MTDEEVNENTALWPSKANIVRLVCDRLASVSFSPALVRSSITLPMNPDVRNARSRPRRMSRRCVRIFLWAFTALLLFLAKF